MKYKIDYKLPLFEHIYNLLCQEMKAEVEAAKKNNSLRLDKGYLHLNDRKIGIKIDETESCSINFHVPDQPVRSMDIEEDAIDIDKFISLYRGIEGEIDGN